MEIYRDRTRLDFSDYSIIRRFGQITKSEAIYANNDCSSMDDLGNCQSIILYILCGSGNATANGFNFIHAYKKNKKLISYLISCSYNAIQYSLRLDAAYRNIPPNHMDMMHGACLFYSEFSIYNDITTLKNLIRSMFTKSGSSDYSYKKDKIGLFHNNTPFDINSYMSTVSSIHVRYISTRMTNYGKHFLSPKVSYTNDSGSIIRRRQANSGISKDIRPFTIRLKRPLIFRSRIFKGVDYYGKQ